MPVDGSRRLIGSACHLFGVCSARACKVSNAKPNDCSAGLPKTTRSAPRQHTSWSCVSHDSGARAGLFWGCLLPGFLADLDVPCFQMPIAIQPIPSRCFWFRKSFLRRGEAAPK